MHAEARVLPVLDSVGFLVLRRHVRPQIWRSDQAIARRICTVVVQMRYALSGAFAGISLQMNPRVWAGQT